MSLVSQEPVEDSGVGPERTCVGCRRQASRDELLRLCVVDTPPFVVPDLGGRLGGRGVWVEARRECVQNAARRGGFARAARRRIEVDPDHLCKMIVEQLRRRVEGLLSSAARTRSVAVGTDVVRAALDERRARLLVVAADAAGRREDLEAAAHRLGNKCIVFGTKPTLGRIFGRGDVGVVAILDAGIAGQLIRAAERVAALSEDE